jgi:hypothetical protein
VLRRVAGAGIVHLAVSTLGVPAVAPHADVLGDVLELAEEQVLLRHLQHLPEHDETDEPLPGLVDVGHARLRVDYSTRRLGAPNEKTA